jgi:integrase
LGKLNDKFVRAERPVGRYHDGDGLYLQVTRNAKTGKMRKSWVFRYRRAGRLREMGLGGLGEVSLGQARKKAQAARDLRASGVDPINHRDEVEREERLASERAKTFRQIAEECIQRKEPAWRNAKHTAQWSRTLGQYVYPVFGNVPVANVTVDDVVMALSPIWTTKPETARRVRSRIKQVLDYAAARKLRSRENPAQWDGVLSELLPRPQQSRRVRHHTALPYSEVRDFMGKLKEQPGIAAKALQFAILTAARTGEVVGARWSEIDLRTKVWIIPAERMKALREHRVPLSSSAVELLCELETGCGSNDHVFGAPRSKKPMSNMAMLAVIKRMGLKGRVTTHGFRSSFRDWCAEKAEVDPSVAEAALAHAAGTKVEQAYLRTDQFEKRKELMQKWNDYLITPASAFDPARKMKKNLQF